MGVCTSDPLDSLTNAYGYNVVRYFVSVKSQKYLDEVVSSMIPRIEEKFFICTDNLDQEFKAKEQTIKKYYNQNLAKALKESRAALQAIKQKQKKSEEQIFGLTNVHDKFMKIRTNKDQKVKIYQQNLIEILTQKKNDLKQQIISKRPSLPLFEEMPFWLKNKVEADATPTFDRELKAQEEKLLKQLQKSINYQSLQVSIRREAGMGQADELEKGAHAAIERIQRNINFYNNSRSCFV